MAHIVDLIGTIIDDALKKPSGEKAGKWGSFQFGATAELIRGTPSIGCCQEDMALLLARIGRPGRGCYPKTVARKVRMFMKTTRKVATYLVAFLSIYLLAAGLWAWASVDAVIAAYPAPADAGLSASQTAILLAIEDPTFFEHGGLSLTDGQGLTTISSSVARDLFLFQGDLPGVKGLFQRFYRGVFACCKKVDIGRDLMAVVLDANLPKARQLSVYASNAYMGTNGGAQVKGFAQASQSYLGKPLGQISDKEFAALVAMVKAPNQFHPARNPAAYNLRVKRVAAVLSGNCKPGGWFDTTYEHCAH